MRVVLEAYVNGVWTRKVDRLVEQLGIGGMTKDSVSALCRALDEQVEVFASGRRRAPSVSVGWRPSLKVRSGGRALQGVGRRLCGPRERACAK